MDESWERAVEAKIEGLASPSSELRVLNLDGAVKSFHGSLPPAGLLERFPSLEHLSIANVRAPSLERFPRLRNLQRLILSDNRIAGGLESLVDAGLHSLRDLDLSNNRIQHIEDLAPLGALQLVSLDLYECPVTRVKDYRSKVFSMIRTLKYLDKLDINENERPDTDEEEEEEDEEYDDEEEDSGSGEVDGGDQNGKLSSGAGNSVDGDEGIVDVDEDEGSDADEEEIETTGRITGSGSSGGSGHHPSTLFRVATTGMTSVEGDEHDADGDDDVEDDDDDDLGEEIDEDEADYEDVAADMHNILDSDDEEDGVDEVEIDEEEIAEDGDEEDLDEDDDVIGVGVEEDVEPASTSRLASTEGEIDGHDHGEDDENGEIGEEEDEQEVEDMDAKEEDFGESEDEDDLDGEYLVQPIARSRSWLDSAPGDEDDEIDYDEEDRPGNGPPNHASSSSESNKRRRRDDGGNLDDDDEAEEPRPSKSKRS